MRRSNGYIRGYIRGGALPLPTESVFEGEHHVPGFNFLGPGTNLQARERAGPPLSEPVTTKGPIAYRIDKAAKQHDYAYKAIGDKLKANVISKPEALEMAHMSDQEFINALNAIPGLSLTKELAIKAIQLKRFAEASDMLDAERFSLPKVLPPARMLDKERDGRPLVGGFIPLLMPLLAAAVSGLTSAGATALINHLTGKEHEGAGYGAGFTYKKGMSDDKKLVYAAHALDNTSPERQLTLLHKAYFK